MEYVKKTIIIREAFYERLKREAFYNNSQVKLILDKVLNEWNINNPEQEPEAFKGSLMEIKEQSMKKAVQEALKQSGGNQSQASKLLNISRVYLSTLIKKYKIQVVKNK